MSPTTTAALVATLLALPAPALAAFPRHVQGEVLVKLRDGTGAGRGAAAVAARAHTALAAVNRGWLRVRLRPGESVEEALAAYAGDPDVERAQPNFLYQATAAVSPDDASYPQQWGLANRGQTVTSVVQAGGQLRTPTSGHAGDDIAAEWAWGIVTDCRAAVVAVVDTGVKYDQQDLAPSMWTDASFPRHGVDCVATQDCDTGDGDPMDENGHGTHVAGIIGAAGNDGVGVAGVCWRASLMAVRVLDASGSGTTLSIASGLDWAVAHGARVVNLSLGGAEYDAVFAGAVDAATAAGVVLVVAAGNDGMNVDAGGNATYPCSYRSPGIVCVAALDPTFALADFSNYGPTSVDVAAPGVNILSTWAGQSSAREDDFTSGWTRSPASGGWTPGTLTFTDGSWMRTLTDPPDLPYSSSPRYPAGADHRASKVFDLRGDVATLVFGAWMWVAAGDTFQVVCAPTSSPFGADQVLLDSVTNVFAAATMFGENLAACRGATASIGVRLQSSYGSPGAYGVALTPLEVQTLTWDTASYNTIAGTSMATPFVAGIAAMLLSYQPAFLPEDVAGALAGGGTPVAALSGRVRSGNAANAYGALRYVNPPRGLTYSVALP